jgi:hypothetical protein
LVPDTVDRTPVLLGGAAQLLVVVWPMVQLELSLSLAFAGAIGGGIAGALTHRYGQPLQNGIVAAGLAGVAACIVVAVYGSYASWQLGLGVDSAFAAQYGFRGLAMFFILVPFQAITGGLTALVGNSLRGRALERFATR